jgi:hypothetical protein
MYPQVFCTTSRDFSARIYDLTYTPIQKPNNPHWPPNPLPSLAGAAHGLHMCEPEGDGIGRCIIVLMGGRSGGHRAAVLGAVRFPGHIFFRGVTADGVTTGIPPRASSCSDLWSEIVSSFSFTGQVIKVGLVRWTVQ